MKKVTGISWRPEVLEALDKYVDTLAGAVDVGFAVVGGHQRSAVVNNLVARELRRLGYAVKYKAVKKGGKK